MRCEVTTLTVEPHEGRTGGGVDRFEPRGPERPLEATPPAGAALLERSLTDPVLDRLREETDGYYAELKKLGGMPSSEIFMTLAGISSRVSEIRKDVHRVPRKNFMAYRTQEVDPLLSECDRQFKYFSRVFSTVELEGRLNSGRGAI